MATTAEADPCEWGCAYGERACVDCGSLRKKYNIKLQLALMGRIAIQDWMKEYLTLDWKDVEKEFPEALPEWDSMWKYLGQDMPAVRVTVCTNPEYLRADPVETSTYYGRIPKWVYHAAFGWMEL